MDNLKENAKKISDLERDIDDINSLEDFSNWIEKALVLIPSIYGKASVQYTQLKNLKNHYNILSNESKSDLDKIKADAFEIIEVCNEGLV